MERILPGFKRDGPQLGYELLVIGYSLLGKRTADAGQKSAVAGA